MRGYLSLYREILTVSTDDNSDAGLANVDEESDLLHFSVPVDNNVRTNSLQRSRVFDISRLWNKSLDIPRNDE